MNTNVMRFDFEEIARLAKMDPEGISHKREALIRQLINQAPRAEPLTEPQRKLGHTRYRWAPGMQLGFQITDMMLQALLFMIVQMSTPN